MDSNTTARIAGPCASLGQTLVSVSGVVKRCLKIQMQGVGQVILIPSPQDRLWPGALALP
jgi:hypothetical protein